MGFKIPKFMWMSFMDGLSSFFLSLPTQHDFPPKEEKINLSPPSRLFTFLLQVAGWVGG